MGRVLLLFRYPGGKFYALNLLKKFWNTPHDEYREPMLGGGSVFFAKPKAKVNWLNDIHSDLITTYKIIADSENSIKLIKRVENEEASKERHGEIKKIEPKSDLDIAFKYFYLNRTSFSGKMRSPSWGYRPKRSLPPARWSERIEPCGEKLDDVKITNIDFEKVIEKPAKLKKVLMYVDPPYYGVAETSHYIHSFTKEDHIRLCKALRKTKHKFFLTYDDHEDIREMYSWAKIYPVEFFYRLDNSQDNKGKRKYGAELVITNYEIKKKSIQD